MMAELIRNIKMFNQLLFVWCFHDKIINLLSGESESFCNLYPAAFSTN